MLAVLCLFSGEEQGLLSSSWYAKQLRARNEDVAFMLQVDMVGFRKPGEPMQLARPDVIGLEVAGHLVGNYSELYVPELVVGCVPPLPLCGASFLPCEPSLMPVRPQVHARMLL